MASAASGYALAKYNNWWLKAFTICILATTMLPAETILAPLFLVVRDLGLYNSLAGVVVPAVITATGTFMFRQFFVTVPERPARGRPASTAPASCPPSSGSCCRWPGRSC